MLTIVQNNIPNRFSLIVAVFMCIYGIYINIFVYEHLCITKKKLF